MKTKRVTFDINKAKSGAKVVTRCGYPVRMSDFDVKNKDGYKLLGIIDIKGNEVPFSFMETGRRGGTETQSEYDLFIEEEVEPMFKVGDWIVQENAGVYKVTEICESWYEVIDFNEWHYSISFDQEPMCHLWNIKDAKDGDVLCSTGLHNDCIFIFNGLDNWKFDAEGDRTVATGYCCLFITADKMEFGIQGPDCIEVNTIKPATKVQRNLLFQKIKEKGYEWNSDTKELKKIDAFPAEKKIKTRRMTNQELSWWLRDCQQERREVCRVEEETIYSRYIYRKCDANEEVPEFVRIRKNGGEWQEPLIEE